MLCCIKIISTALGRNITEKEWPMNKEDLKKLLAGIGITALLSGTSIGAPDTQQAGKSG